MVLAKNGDKVRVHYIGKLEDGSQFDASRDDFGFGEPLEFTIGNEQMIPGFEQGVIGMQEGESKTVHIKSVDGYGEHHPEGLIEIERDQLPSGMPLEVGGMVQGNSPTGGQVAFTVVEITQSKVTLDSNHPLAGKDLIFEVHLVGIE